MATVASTPMNQPRRGAPPGRAVFAVRRRRGGFDEFPAGRVIFTEIALVALVLAVFAPGPVTRVLFVVCGVALLALVLVRRHGRWWLPIVAERRALGRRRRAARDAVGVAARTNDPRQISLAAVAPGAAVRAFVDRSTTIGVGQDDNGWYCALAVAPWTTLSGDRSVRVTLDRLARIFAETSVPVSALQVVSHLVPAPTGAVDPGTPLAQSYRELLGTDVVQADQLVWIAARLDPRDGAAAAASRGGGLDGVDRALATTIARVGKALSEVDIPYRILDDEGLLDAVSSAIGYDGGQFDERWRVWYAGGLAQLCFEITDWPRTPDPDFLAALGRIPAALVSVSVSLSPADGEVGLRGLLRIGADRAQLARAAREAEEVARRAGARLRRLDGAHGPGVYATSPTGGVA
jgi:type VII secretion protein EccE